MASLRSVTDGRIEGKPNRHGHNGILRHEQSAYGKGARFKNQSFELKAFCMGRRANHRRLRSGRQYSVEFFPESVART
jgi:hypothetical protein